MKKDFFELTKPQKSIWLTEQVYKGTNINNICTTGTIYGLINVQLLKRAINYVVKQHDSFRTRICLQNDIPKQYITDFKDFEIEVQYITTADELKEIEKEQAKLKFDILDSDLFKFKIVVLKNKFACVILTTNHIISDSWSMGITIQEILKNYYALEKNEAIDFEAQSYIDFINSEIAYKNSEKYSKDKKYWNEVFTTIPNQATIPSTVLKSDNNSINANRISFDVEKSIVKQINDFCKEAHISAFNFFMSVYSLYIGRVSNTEDFVIGTPILNRLSYKDKHTTGMFVNTAPIRINNSSYKDFKSITKSIAKQTLEILRHQRYSYNSILEDLRKKNKNLPNLYNIMISYQITKAYNQAFGNYTTNWTFNGTCSNDIDIHIYDINATGNLKISYDYLINKYTLADIQNIHSQIIYIISQIIKNPDISTEDIEFINEEEKHKILYEFNDTKISYNKEKTITDLFEEQVKKTPDKVALVFEDKQLTYKQLNEKANGLAYYLRNTAHIGRNDIVGIMVNRSFEMIISIIAVLKAGGAYIPIDPTYPKSRIEYMLHNSNAKLLITQEHLKDYTTFKNKVLVDLTTIHNENNVSNINQPDDLSYVIFTSGSTGKPKGVMLNHKALTNLTNYCNNYIEYLKKPTYKAIASITTISFDIFIFESLISLQKGLKVVIANENEQTSPALLNSLIEKYDIQILQSTPSRMQIFMNNIKDMPSLKNINYLTLAGEQLPLSLVNKLQHLTNITIYNGYGPSETTVFSTLTKINSNYITIGRPLYNTQIYILNNNLKPVPIGVSGELYISGDGVGKGYINNDTLTNQSFIPNPFIPNTLMYKTGDLGKYLPNGEILCLGRVDHQVKIRGLRIELGEIEEKINELSFITSCVVTKKIDDNSHEFLCAYFTAKEKTEPYSIRSHLEKFLPKYMVPQFFMQMDALPYTPNGKINRNKLPVPEFKNEKPSIVLPRNNTDAKLIDILKDTLNIDIISIDDDFFNLGGDSLSAINLSVKIQNIFNCEIYVKDILEHPRIQDLSDFIANIDVTTKKQIIPRVKPAEYYPASSGQKRMFFASQMAGSNSIIYNIPGGIIFDGLIDITKLKNCFIKLINRHEALRTYFDLANNTVVQKILPSDEAVKNINLEIIENATFEDIDTSFTNFVKPFDLSCAPLFRAKIVQFTNGKSALFVDMHHIIADGTSLNILIDELNALYNNKALPELTLTYKDFASFENQKLETDALKEAEDYWISQFSDEAPVLNMPTKSTRQNVQNFEGKKVYSNINSNSTQKIDELAKQLGITPYMFLLACYYILLYKYTSQKDIIIGSPIIGRDELNINNIIGIFINTLPLRNSVNDNLSFKDFILNIKENVLNAYKYQAYPLDELINKLHLQRDTSRNPLFDTMFTYQNNGFRSLNFNKVNANYYIPDTGISKFDLSLEAIPNHNQIKLTFEYSTQLFSDEFISGLSNHYINLVNCVLDKIDTKIDDINMISKDETHNILYNFNNTVVEYPKNKTIATLFEEQVKKTPDKIALVFEDKQLTYKELNNKANSLAYYLRNTAHIGRNDLIGIMVNRSFEMIISIIAVLKAGGAYIPIDPTFPKDRIEYMLHNSNAKLLLTQEHLKNYTTFKNKVLVDLTTINTENNLYNLPNNNLKNINQPDDLAYVIFTSGSTGNPKGVMLMHKNVINFIYGIIKKIDIKNLNAIASITTISFDIFVLESILPLLTGLKIVLANEKEQTNVKLFNELCKKNKVDAFQTTPSRIQAFLTDSNYIDFMQIAKYILIGGEQFPHALLEECKKTTKAKIYNMYGPTETTVWSSIKELTNSNLITIGAPLANTQIYILDNNLKSVPIGVSGELYISGDGVGKGYINNKALTNQSFIPNPFIPNTLMYKTGDLGKYLLNGEIVCLGRVDHQVKIRGLRIELGEIEEKISELSFITSCVVTKKVDNSHEFLCAYFTAKDKIEPYSIRSHLEKFLPKYMVPQFFMQMDALPYTPNGKIDRNKLPVPEFKNEKPDIVLPRNNTDAKLIDILKETLNIDIISIDDDFFNLGGDSLSAINLSVKIQNIFNCEIYVKDILEHPRIQDLSDFIANIDGTTKTQIIPRVKPAEYYPASSAQKRMFFASQMARSNSIIYNIPGGIIFEELIDTKKIKNCFIKLINRHEALRTYFALVDNTVVQKILPNDEAVKNINLDIIKNATFEDIDTSFTNFVKPFDLSCAPLFRAKIVQFTNGKSALFVDMHHIIADGTSLNILIDELSALYNNKALPELTLTYKDFASFENKKLETAALKEAQDYWIAQFSDEPPVLNMPIKSTRPAVQSFEGSKIYTTIPANTVAKINSLCKKLSITPYMLLLSCYYILLSKYTSQNDIIIGTPVADRYLTDTYNIVGMFVNTLALRNTVKHSLSFKDFVLSIKENILNAYKYQNYPFDELVDALNIKRDTSRNPLFDTMFIYQNKGYKNSNFDNITSHYYIANTNISKFDLSLEVIPNNDELKLSFEYATQLFTHDFINSLSNHYINIINYILDNISSKISDIPLLSSDEANNILYEFNNTTKNYPKDKTIAHLFEEQVKKTPNNIALIFENKKLTYIELNEKVNSLAYYLRNTAHVGRNDLIGIMVNRSFEMIISILAVLKAGGAYIPIDPTYPKDRIEYMLNNSKAKLLLTQNHLKNTIEFKNTVIVDLNNVVTDNKIYDLPKNNIKIVNKPEDLAYVIFTSGSTGHPKGVMLTHNNIINFIYGIIDKFNFSSSTTIASITTISFDIFVLESLMPLLNGLKIVIANENEQTTIKLFNELCIENSVDIIQSTPSRFQAFLSDTNNIDFIKNASYLLVGGEEFPQFLLENLKQHSNAKIYNMYGPTETAVWSSTKNLTNSNKITIGKPISNTQIYILDNGLIPLPIGVPGELYISGDGVCKGYLNNADLNKKSFIKNPFIPNTIMYKTGDLGMYTSDGEIICLGRTDNQIKIRGLRIELGEIEATVLKYSNIEKTVVIKKSIQNRDFITCYYVANKRINKSELRKYLEKSLPKYMIPSYFIALNTLPYTPNGKIDKKALPIPTELLHIEDKEYIRPKTKLQKQLVSIWEKILSTKPIGISDNFFELGGDSLLAMNLNIELSKITNKISYADIFRYPTIAELEEKINSISDTLMFSKIEGLSDKYVHILNKTKKHAKIKKYHPKNILLTGATGFLGIHILEQLLKYEDANIYCIVREDPNILPKTKLHQKLNYYFGNKYDNLIDKKIFVIPGDTSKPYFGLNQDDLLILANSIEIVINSAANVAHFGDFSKFYKDNVTSVKYIVDFCKSFNAKLYHVSTISVTGFNLDSSYLYYKKKQWLKKNKINDIIFDESSLYIGQIIENVYVRSKFEAEHYILNAINNGLDGYILRMGHLMPRYKDGAFQENILDNELINKILSFMRIGSIPNYLLKFPLELTPVDQAANAICKLISHPTNKNRIFHLYNHHYIQINKLLKVAKKNDYNIEVISEKTFINKVHSMLQDDSQNYLLKNIFDDFDNDFHLTYENHIKTSSTFTIRYLRKLGFNWHKFSNKYLNSFIKLLKKVV